MLILVKNTGALNQDLLTADHHAQSFDKNFSDFAVTLKIIFKEQENCFSSWSKPVLRVTRGYVPRPILFNVDLNESHFNYNPII